MSTLTLDDLKGSFKTNNKKRYYYRSEYITELDKVILTVFYGTNKTCNSTYSIECIYYNQKTYDQLDTIMKGLVNHRKDQILSQLNNGSSRLLKNGYHNIYPIGDVVYLLTVTQITTSTKITTYMGIDNVGYGNDINKNKSEIDDIDDYKNSVITSCMLEMKEVCNKTPISIHEPFTIGDCQFMLDLKYIKPPCSTAAYANVYMDENIYRESPITISADDIENNIENLRLSGQYGYKKLKEAIKSIPISTSETFSVGRLSFNITTNLFKEVLNGIVRYEVYCDGIKYADGIVDVTVSTLSTVANDIKDYTDGIIERLKKLITTVVPPNTSERFKTNNLSYILGVVYIKSPDNETVTVNITIDDDIYVTKLYSLSFETVKSNSDSIVQQVTRELNNVKQMLIDNTLANSTYVRSKNKFSYAISIQYLKDPGIESISLRILVDGRDYISYTHTISTEDLIANITSLKQYTQTQITNLNTIIDKSPKNTNKSKFLVDNFEYTGGIYYSKTEGNPSVTVKFYVQGKVKRTLNYNLYAENLQDNLNTLISDSKTKFETIKRSLYSIAPTTVSYNVGSCYFEISVIYDKLETSNYIMVTPRLDSEPILEPVAIEFSKTKSIFTNKGNELIETIKTKLNNNTPRTNIADYTVHGFTYYTGYKFTKSANNNDVTISTLIDSEVVGETKILPYDIENGNTLLDTAINMFYVIRNKLDNDTPEDYSNKLSVHGFYFALGSTFTKASNSKTVTVKTVLDGTVRATNNFGDFSIYNVQYLLNKAKSEEDKITDKLVHVPSNVQKIWSYDDRFFFLVDIEYEKDANSNEIRSKLMIDKELHGEIIKGIFNINSISSISNAITQEANRVEEYYGTIIPDAIRRMYSKNGYHFSVDCYFSKKAGSTNMLIKIVVTYLDKDQEDMTIILTTSLKNKLFKNVTNNIYMIESR